MAKTDRPGSKSRDPAEAEDLLEVGISPAELIATLARLDLEAALAYDAAADLCGDPELSRQLTRFAHDHRRHVEELNRVLAREGEPEPAPPEGGAAVLAGIVKVAGPLGPDVIVVALLGNEQLTNLSYDAALAYEWDGEDEALLERFVADERRHLAWLAQRHEALAGRAAGPGQPGTPG